MKKLFIALAVIAVVVIACFAWFKTTYNTMVTMNENVAEQWSNVENQYQRRLDLIPNLVSSVKGYADHEKSTLEAVIDARAKATQTQVNFNNLDANAMKQLNQAQGELSGALSRLMAVAESYPNLKANENFLDLQAQLEGTENRIAVERRKYNEMTKIYNAYTRSFPKNIVANMFGFESKPYFEATAQAETAPKVEF